MNQKIKKYLNSLFEGLNISDELKEELSLNLNDKYEDLINTDPSTLYCFGTSVTSGKADTPESSCKDPNAIDFKIKVSSGKVTITND